MRFKCSLIPLLALNLFSDLPDVLRKISCRMFFTTDDREEYKTNKSNVPGYKTAVVNTPVLGKTTQCPMQWEIFRIISLSQNIVEILLLLHCCFTSTVNI